MPSLIRRIIILAGLYAVASYSNAQAATYAPPLVSAHKITVSVDVSKRTVTGKDVMTLKGRPAALRLVIRSASSVDAAFANDKPLKMTTNGLPSRGVTEAVIKLPAKGAETVEIRFHGSFPDIDSARANIKRGVAFVDDGVMGDDGVFLPSNSAWYPQEDNGLAVYDAEVSISKAFTTVMEGTLVKSGQSGALKTERWLIDRPCEGLDLVAGRYAVVKEPYKGIDLYTYFFEKDDTLSRLYMDKTKEYLDFYDGLIGPYPFKKFAVVESFLPTGYGMPSFTLLGSAVIRLPFIPETSLGHEIAHNWWGNSVYRDERNGNWTEAITTATADYLYAEKKGQNAARDFRFSKLLGYKNFAQDSTLTLADFNDATEPASRAIGYNKGSMVFLMLRDVIGNDAFLRGLHTFYKDFAFKRASWDDIRLSFETASGKDLKWFFDQWLKIPGGPSLSIDGPALRWTAEGKHIVKFNIRQTNPHTLTLPIRFDIADGAKWVSVTVTKELETVGVELASLPLAFEIDPDYEVFRILSDVETPPSLSSCFGDKTSLIVIPSDKTARKKYKSVAKLISKDFGGKVVIDTDLVDTGALKGKTAFILGNSSENRAFGLATALLPEDVRLEGAALNIGIDGSEYSAANNLFALAVKGTDNPGRTLCLFFGDGQEDKVFETGKRLRYFGESSYLVFGGKGSPIKGQFKGKRPLRHKF